MTSGVYTITSPDGDLYVGSAKSIERRWTQHKTDLRIGRHHNKRLREVAEKCGVASLRLDIVLICEEGELLLNEQKTIDSLHPNCNINDIVGTKSDPDVVIANVVCRIPASLREKLAEEAKRCRMSANSYIIDRLERSFDQPTRPTVEIGKRSLGAIEACVKRAVRSTKD